MHTTLTPACLHEARFCSLKKPRSEPYSCGARPKDCLWRWRENATWTSSGGLPLSTSYCVIRPAALSARKTLWPNSTRFRITVEAVPNEEIYRLVKEFASDLWDRRNGVKRSAEEAR